MVNQCSRIAALLYAVRTRFQATNFVRAELFKHVDVRDADSRTSKKTAREIG